MSTPEPDHPASGHAGAGASRAGQELPLPPGLDLLWGRRERGKRGPRPGLSADAIVAAAIRVADADGLEAVSMARVAKELGFTTMSLYRYVDSKDELLQLMWNGSAQGVESLVLEGADWREKLRAWAVIQRDLLDRHPWITQMPMPAPPLAPNSLHFVELGLAAFDGTGLPDAYRLQIIGLISSYTLSEARMAHDAARAARQAAQAMREAMPEPPPGEPASQVPVPTYETLLRELIDQQTYPHLHRLAWSSQHDGPDDERGQFLWGLDCILDGAQVLINRQAPASG